MKNLNNLLERFKKSLNHDTESKEEVISCITSITNIKLETKDVSIKNGILYISSSPIKNNEIRLREEKVLDYLKSNKGINLIKIFYK